MSPKRRTASTRRKAGETWKRIGVLVVDGNALVRTGLCAILAKAPGVRVVGAAASAADAIRMVKRLRPDVVLMETRPPDETGLRACSKILRECRGARILVVSYEIESGALAPSPSHDGHRYLLKGIELLELVRAIRAVADGRFVLGPILTGELLIQMARAVPGVTPEHLSEEEERVLAMLVQGKQNKEISSALGVSGMTVRATVGRIYKKVRITARARAAVFHTKGPRRSARLSPP